MIFPAHFTNLPVVKPLIIASLIALLLSSCGGLRKKEIGPYGDKRSRWEKFKSYEEERYDDWADKWMHRDAYKRRKANAGNKENP